MRKSIEAEPMTKRESTPYKIEFPVYGLTVNIIVTTDIEWSRNKRVKQIGSYFNDSDGATAGLFSRQKGASESFLFLPPDPKNINTISHECSHATHWIFETIGADYEQETHAYHLGYLCGKAMEAIGKHSKTKK